MMSILQRHYPEFLAGLRVTFSLALIIWCSGLTLGTALGVAASVWQIAVGWPLRILALLLSAIPALVFMFWFHYPLQMFLEIVVNPFVTAAVSLSLINVILVADQCYHIIDQFPKHYVTAGRVTGMTSLQIIRYIGLPIAMRQLVPPLLNSQIIMLQATLFASLISVDEIFRVAQRVNSQIYKPVEIYTLLALFFVCICVPLHLVASTLKKRFNRDLSEN